MCKISFNFIYGALNNSFIVESFEFTEWLESADRTFSVF